MKFHPLPAMLAVLASLVLPLYAADYTWNAPGASSWTTSSNWFPNTGYPQAPSDSAFFTSASVSNCTISQNLTIGSLTMDEGYTGTISVSGLTASLKASTITLSGGVLQGISLTPITATSGLRISGGQALLIACEGDAVTSGGTIGVLRMRGADSHLTGAPLPGQVMLQLHINAGKTSLSSSVNPATLTVDAGTTLALEPLSTVITASSSIKGAVRLSSATALTFVQDATVPAEGVIKLAPAGSAVVCMGSWNCLGQFIPSGNLLNTLVIYQATGGTVNHGTNAADSIIISTGVGYKTIWSSSNTVQSLTILSSSTLEVAAGKVLSVEQGFVNGGTLVEVAPGYVHNPAQMQAMGPDGFTIATVGKGQPFRVRLIDGDENLDAATTDTARNIQITNLRNGDKITSITAAETRPATAIFTTVPISTVEASAAVTDSALQVLPGDLLQIRYIDDEDAGDNAASATLRVINEASARDWQYYR